MFQCYKHDFLLFVQTHSMEINIVSFSELRSKYFSFAVSKDESCYIFKQILAEQLFNFEIGSENDKAIIGIMV